MRFAMLGAGAWGTALGFCFAKLGHTVYMVPRDARYAADLRRDGENKEFLPGYPLGALKVAFEDPIEVDVAFFACPSKGLDETCERAKVALKQQPQAYISLCKGFNGETQERPTEIIRGHFPHVPVGTISGPTYANEVAEGKPTAMTLASASASCRELQSHLNGPQIRIYSSSDVIGVELGGCLKNVYAIGAGMCDGLKLGDNAKASYLVRATHEMVSIGTRLGGKAETFFGPSGLGDLIATCSGKWSRNRTFGETVASGIDVVKYINETPKVVEGYGTTKYFYNVCKQLEHSAPFLEGVYAVLYEGMPIKEAYKKIMSRPL